MHCWKHWALPSYASLTNHHLPRRWRGDLWWAWHWWAPLPIPCPHRLPCSCSISMCRCLTPNSSARWCTSTGAVLSLFRSHSAAHVVCTLLHCCACVVVACGLLLVGLGSVTVCVCVLFCVYVYVLCICLFCALSVHDITHTHHACSRTGGHIPCGGWHLLDILCCAPHSR